MAYNNYHITSENISAFKEAIYAHFSELEDSFLSVQNAVQAFIDSESYTGPVADQLKTYLANKYCNDGISVVSLFKEFIDDYKTNLDYYDTSYYIYENGSEFVFDYDSIDDYKRSLDNKVIDVLDSMDNIKTILDSINGIETPDGVADYSRPDTTSVESYAADGDTYILGVHTAIEELETSGVEKATELETGLEELTNRLDIYRDCCKEYGNPCFLQAKVLEEITEEEIAELISLQGADRDSLPPEAVRRLEELENKVLYGSEKSRQTYRDKIEDYAITAKSAEMLAFGAKLEAKYAYASRGEHIEVEPMTNTEMGELIGLQTLDRDLLPPEALARLEELEDKLLKADCQTWIAYRDRIEGIELSAINDDMKIFNQKLGEKIYKSSLTEESKIVMDLVEQAEFFDMLAEQETDPQMINFYKTKSQELYASAETVMSNKIARMNHVEEFSFVFEYIDSLGYDTAEKAEIFYHWESIDECKDISGIEMPEKWKKEYLTLPDWVEIDESNIRAVFEEGLYGQELTDLYLRGYFIIDCMSGREWVEYNGSIYADEDSILYTSDNLSAETIRALYNGSKDVPEYMDMLMDTWYDDVYGGMYDYVSGKDSVRAVKYGLEKYIWFPQLYTEHGVYKIYDNYESGYYNFCVSAYIYKYDHEKAYYEDIKTSDNVREKILSYIAEDKNKPISEKEFSAEEQKIIYFNKKAYENGELMYCKNMYDIADQLQNDETVFSYGGEEYVVKVEGDKIIITACIIDSMAYASDRHWDEYVIDFSDCKMDAFGSVYIVLFSTLNDASFFTLNGAVLA